MARRIVYPGWRRTNWRDPRAPSLNPAQAVTCGACRGFRGPSTSAAGPPSLDLITTLAPGGSGLFFLCEENRRLRQEPTMLIIGCDFHAGFQVLAIFDNRTGVTTEKRLEHPQGAMEFYRSLREQGERVRVGIEAGAPCQWFRRLLGECGHELWVGDAA